MSTAVPKLNHHQLDYVSWITTLGTRQITWKCKMFKKWSVYVSLSNNDLH